MDIRELFVKCHAFALGDTGAKILNINSSYSHLHQICYTSGVTSKLHWNIFSWSNDLPF